MQSLERNCIASDCIVVTRDNVRQLIGGSGSGGSGLGAGLLPPDSGSGGLPSGFVRGSGVVVP